MTNGGMTPKGMGMEMTMDMTLDRLQRILDAYGADPARWPAEEREAAAALLARSPEAQAHARLARAIDDGLDCVAPPPPSAALAAVLEARGREIVRPRATRAGARMRPAPLGARMRAWLAGLLELPAPTLARAATFALVFALGLAAGVAVAPIASGPGDGARAQRVASIALAPQALAPQAPAPEVVAAQAAPPLLTARPVADVESTRAVGGAEWFLDGPVVLALH